VWIDSHCHVTAAGFDEDRLTVLDRARQSGLEQLVAVGAGYGLEHNELAADLAREHRGIFATAGLHPHDASLWSADAEADVRRWLDRPEVVAIGECGLDYHYMNSPREAQRRAFEGQVEIARELGLPVVIHVRDDGPAAYDELLDIWKTSGQGQVNGVLHCYTGTLEFARQSLDYGFNVSFSGIVTFKKSASLRSVARGLPLDCLMVETDAPFLAPEGYRGKRNEPAWVPRVGETLAELHGVSPERLAQITRENTQRLFGLDPEERLLSETQPESS